jgi:ATP-dependent RNA helicase DeaD
MIVNMSKTESGFAALGLRESLLRTLTTLGYEVPTPIQERTIPVLLAGRDLIGQAQTGTGKTAAFALPILEKIDPEKRETQALVLTPTRELAMQVAEALHAYAHLMRDITVLPVYGGAPIVHQLKRLERGVQVVVGTPGRLIDHLDRKTLRLDAVRIVVLDEADEMLKMGFIDDVERILAEAPESRQIALFSATMPAEVLRIAQRHMRDAERVEIEHKSLAAPAIEQRFLNVSEAQKLEVLTQILELEDHPAVLIFRRTKNGAAELTERLEGRGFAAVAMHGDMKQSEREHVIRRLKSGNIEIVVATDVAARGLDVEQISHVINYDIPNDVEAYVHRIGRTGRAGRSGSATLFVTPRERRMMRDIERFIGTQIKPMKMPTRADVAARRVSQLKDAIRKEVDQGDLDLYLSVVEELIEEGRHDVAEIAAAAARMASTARPIAESQREAAPPPDAGRRPFPADGPGDASAASTRPWQPASRPSTQRNVRPGSHDRGGPDQKVRLAMSVGKRDGIRPADVVGSIANEADVPGRDIGPIDIRDDITFVTVPASAVERVIARVGGRRFRGREIDLHVAGEAVEGSFGRDPGERHAKRSFAPRQEGRPARDFRSRAEERPAREFRSRGAAPPRKPGAGPAGRAGARSFETAPPGRGAYSKRVDRDSPRGSGGPSKRDDRGGPKGKRRPR